MAKYKHEFSDWELEKSLELPASLEELVNAPPFKESSDEHGHSVTAGTRIPQWLHRRVVKLIETPGTPYELTSDVLRDAVYLGLRVLHLRHKLSSDWEVDSKLAAITDDAGAAKRIRIRFEELEEGLEDLCAGKDEEQAAERLSGYILAVADYENLWYKNKMFMLIKESRVSQRVLKHCPKNIQDIAEKEASK